MIEFELRRLKEYTFNKIQSKARLLLAIKGDLIGVNLVAYSKFFSPLTANEFIL